MSRKTKIVCSLICVLLWAPLAIFLLAGGTGKMIWPLFALGLFPTLCGMYLASHRQEEINE
ncbi:MAG TPA: hypothetical protein DDY52_00345 [Candidatus Moranbacteria bacterium]|nr:MAG: hypothetical protein UR51_C0027G0005 [Candidatus Moranbacteria bacterium GW2011_GWF1_34_10]HBI16598.1 hypothetical protein [Candidatus Moranbacteria bacterium]